MDRAQRIPTIEAFGQELLESGDLDPLYIALVGAKLDRNQLRRWLFAYWCCYHAGASSYISESDGSLYWSNMFFMAGNTSPTPLGGRWPRGHERRHFRGSKAVHAVLGYAHDYPHVERLLVSWEDVSHGQSFANLRGKVTRLPQFGPWIAFKVGDMLERVMGVPIDFTNADVMMFEQPYTSALQVWEASGSEIAKSTVSESQAVRKVSDRLVGHFSQFKAPPHRDRPVGIQEVETILCKWKSHNNGAYPMGIDTHDLHEGLEEWATVSPTARKLLAVEIK